MKKIFYLFGFLFPAMISCSEDKTATPNVIPAVDGVTMLVAKPETLAIEDNGTTRAEALPRVWNADAAAGVFGSVLGNNTEYKLFDSYAGSEEGVFYGDEVQGVLYIYYPYDARCVRDGSKIVIPIPEEQRYNEDFGLQLSAYEPSLVATSTTSEVEFRYVVGAIGVQVQGGSIVKRIAVESELAALSGDIAVDFAHDYEVSAVGGSSKRAVLDCGDGVATPVDEPKTFYILVPAGTYGDLTVTVETDGDAFSKTLDGSFTVNRLTAVDTSNPMSNAAIVAEFDTLEIGGQSYDGRTWAAGSAFGVFADGMDNAKYVIASDEAGKKAAVFAGKELKGSAWAYYPWSNLAEKNGDVLTLSMSPLQTYDPDMMKQFAENAPFMIARIADGENPKFKYLTGALGLRIKADCQIRKIEITAAEGVALSGIVDVDLNADFAVSATEGSKNVLTLDCGEDGVAASYEQPTTLFVMLPPATYSNLTVTVYSVDGSVIRDVARRAVDVGRLSFNESSDDISYSVIDVALEQAAIDVKTKWAESDTIAFYDADNGGVAIGQLFRNIGVGNTTATFTAPSPNVYGIYPPPTDMADISVNGKVLSFVWPAVQMPDAVADMPMVGTVKNDVVEMKNLGSVLELSLSGDVSVNKIVVKSASHKLSGAATVDMSYADVPTVVMASSAGNTVTIDCGEGFRLDGAERRIKVVLPPATYADDDLRIDVYTELGVYRDMRTTCTLERAKMFAAAVAVPQPKSLTEGNAFANCFILNERGWYSFDAKTRGGFTSVGSENMLNANTAAYVLFELNDEMISGATYLPEQEKITFNYDGSAGNAGICIADAKDNIQWTWTLWCPGEEVQTLRLGTTTWLDRNIGALAIPKSADEAKTWTDLQYLRAAGMTFEMGRPTPFPGAVQWKNEAFADRFGETSNTVSTKYLFPSASKLTNGQKFKCGVGVTVKTAEQGVKNPMHYFILKNSSGSQYWSEDFKLDTGSEAYTWNYSVPSHIQYDPCPAGYRLPSADESKKAFGAYTWTNVIAANMTRPDGMYATDADGKFVYLAKGGYRVNYGLFNATGSSSVHFLISTVTGNAHNRAYVGVTGTHNTSTSQWITGNGANVRCIAE